MGHDALAAADLAGAFGAGFDAAAAADAPGVGFDKAAAVDAPDVNFDKAATADPVEEPAVAFDAAAATDAPDLGSGLYVPVAAAAASASAAVSAPQASAAAFAAFAAFAAASVSEARGPLLQIVESPNLAGSSSSESQREPASQSVFVKPGCLSRRTFRHTTPFWALPPSLGVGSDLAAAPTAAAASAPATASVSGAHVARAHASAVELHVTLEKRKF